MLDYDVGGGRWGGDLADPSSMAVITVLHQFSRPDVSVEREEIMGYTLKKRVLLPPAILYHLPCVTLSFFEGGETALVDATLQEQQKCVREADITADKHGEVCQITKTCGVPTKRYCSWGLSSWRWKG